ncbi:DUF159 family protein [Lactobacillus sp. XV13L]|nr:DUF159 family protein [Lactobacillus sp. XV13L]
MCNQFQLPRLAEIKKYLTTDLKLPLSEPASQLPQDQDVFPSGLVPVLVYQGQQLLLTPKSWGYPSPVNNKAVVFNARVERFFEQKPSMWDASFARRRCIIIARQFYESGQQTYLAANGRRYHERFSFSNAGAPLTLIAGIYEEGHFAMATTAPNGIMAPVHDRMPLVLEADELRRWLFQDFSRLLDRSRVDLTVAKLAART